MLFKKILDEEVFEINKSQKEVIEKMIKLNGDCRTTDSIHSRLGFFCNKKGKLRIRAYYRFQGRHRLPFKKIYNTSGEVLSENGKTKVRIYHYHDYLAVPLQWLIVLCFFTGLIIYGAFIGLPAGFLVFAILSAVFGTVYTIYTILSEKNNVSYNWELVKKELEERIEAIKRWDD